jgi:hypothetical protein
MGNQKSTHTCSGGVEDGVFVASAQSGQALWPFESQIPGSNPGRSTCLQILESVVKSINNRADA